MYVDNRKVAIMLETALAWIVLKAGAIVILFAVFLYAARRCFGGQE